MKYLSFIIAALLFTGIGCISNAVLSNSENSSELSTQASTIVGVIRLIDVEAKKISIALDERHEDSVLFDGQFPEAEYQIGDLVQASGTRDKSTNFIQAREVQKLEGEPLYVTSPFEEATVTSPLIVTGFSQNDRVLQWQIFNEEERMESFGFDENTVFTEGSYTPFRVEIFLPAIQDKAFSLVLKSLSFEGEERGSTTIPLNLLSNRLSSFDVYAKNNFLNQPFDCRNVYPIERTLAKTAAAGRASLVELMGGVSKDEQSSGYTTALNKDTQLISFLISRDTAFVELSKPLSEISNNCDRLSAEAQIQQTLLQFPEVSQVEIK